MALVAPILVQRFVSRWQVTAVWHNMREEVCIYVNGRPYVLREEERPFKNMQVSVCHHCSHLTARCLRHAVKR